ncbi:MAG: MerR family transcriptional regulator [Syntrophomonadaceae bacterium]|jgi:DNA-binding transcriptional MerR regulator|nr:MerR family transcriptional regulator [Syntrophomonadaceae bacterium]
MSEKYRISELAQKAGVTNRTVHYYVGRGLLPPPDGAGVGTTYREEHLSRLRLIKKLQEKYLPLEKIKEIISGMNVEEIEQALEDKGLQHPARIQGIAFDTSVIEKTMYSETEDRTDCPLLVPIDDYRAAVDGNREDVYIRAVLGAGIELHVPAKLLEEQPDLIAKVRKYTTKLIKAK